ncbi:MAG: hypothetical protein WDW36_004551 [Sanguina aurantia]
MKTLYVGGDSEESTVPFLDRSIYLAEYAACCPAIAGAKSRSLISRVAAASSQQHDDDDDDDGGAVGFRMPTTDQEAWTLDGWGDAPSVSDRAQYASNLLAKYAKDVPTTLLALSSPAGNRRAASANSCGYQTHASMQPTQCPRKGGAYRRRSLHTVRSTQIDARSQGSHSPTRQTLTSLEVGDESDVEPSASASASWSNRNTDSVVTDPHPRSANPPLPGPPVRVSALSKSEPGVGPPPSRPEPAVRPEPTAAGARTTATAITTPASDVPGGVPHGVLLPPGGSSLHFVVQPCRNPRGAGRGHAATPPPERSPPSLPPHRSGSLPGCTAQQRCSSSQPTATPASLGLTPLSFDPPPSSGLTLTGHSRVGQHAPSIPPSAGNGTPSRAATLPPHRVDPQLLPLRTGSSSSGRGDVAGQILNSWLLESSPAGLGGWDAGESSVANSLTSLSAGSNVLPPPKVMQHSSSFTGGIMHQLAGMGVNAFGLFPHSQQPPQQHPRSSGGGACSPPTLLQRLSHQPRLADLSLMPDSTTRTPPHDVALPRPPNQHTRHVAAAVAAAALRRQAPNPLSPGSSPPALSLSQTPSPHTLEPRLPSAALRPRRTLRPRTDPPQARLPPTNPRPTRFLPTNPPHPPRSRSMPASTNPGQHHPSPRTLLPQPTLAPTHPRPTTLRPTRPTLPTRLSP